MDQRGADLDHLIDSAERIAVVGSPSSTSELSLDLLGTAVDRKLVGELALFRYQQDGASHYALGQITEVTLKNVWHEDPTIRSLVRMRGRVDAVSERQDTHQGETTISAVFAVSPNGYRPSMLGTVPATGTSVSLVNDDILDVLLAPYRQQLFYLGHVYGSTPKLPLWFKHFDSGPDGAGEAYHLGIFGKTGSGKSVLAKMIILAYARYPQMALLVIDPQGEFAKEARGEPVGEFRLPVRDVLRSLGRQATLLTVRDVVLDRWELFEEILYQSGFFNQIGVRASENQKQASEVLAERLRRDGVNLADLHSRDAFNRAWSRLQEERVQNQFYGTSQALTRLRQQMAETDTDELYRLVWLPVGELFRQDRPNARTVEQLLIWMFSESAAARPLVIVDLSEQQARGLFWNETIQALVIRRLLEGIRIAAERAYRENRSLNTLVVMDEAHRLAPREAPQDDERRAVRDTLIRSVRETRKYGLGWTFISQTLSSLHSEIVGQLRIYFFGFGLSLGTEYDALRQLVGSGSKALDLYRLFRDPHSSFDIASREYSFMTIGPVSPLSFAGTPLFFNAFNDPQTFLSANRFQVQQALPLRSS